MFCAKEKQLVNYGLLNWQKLSLFRKLCCVVDFCIFSDATCFEVKVEQKECDRLCVDVHWLVTSRMRSTRSWRMFSKKVFLVFSLWLQRLFYHQVSWFWNFFQGEFVPRICIFHTGSFSLDKKFWVKCACAGSVCVQTCLCPLPLRDSTDTVTPAELSCNLASTWHQLRQLKVSKRLLFVARFSLPIMYIDV